jgi:hypothetical protein
MPVTMEHSLLPIKKAEGNNYRPVQDLQAVTNTIIRLHPVVPNSYTLPRLLPLQASWFICLDLKDIFFFLHLAPVSQPLFAFEWEDSHTGRKTRMSASDYLSDSKTHPLFSGKP